MPSSLLPQPNVYRDLRDTSGNYNDTVLQQMNYHIFFTGTQTPYLQYQFPQGVAMKLPVQMGFDLNSHNINRTSDTTLGEVYTNLYAIDSSEVQRVAQNLILDNHTIYLPAHQITTITRTFTMSQTINVFQLWSHSHEHTVEFRVERVGGAHNGELIYFSNDWQHPPILRMNQPMTINSGEGLKLITKYNNQTNAPISWGLLSTDEMQMLFGLYYTGTVLSTNENLYSPNTFSLSQNYPNPFNPFTIFNFQLPISSNVTLKVYDILGNEIETLVNENLSAGIYKRTWNAEKFSSGIYFYRLNVERNGVSIYNVTKKLLLLK